MFAKHIFVLASQIFQLCTSKKLWNLKSTTKNIYIVLLCLHQKIMTNISL